MTSQLVSDREPLARVGSVIAGKYRLESLLGEGGMGEVWRAFHLQLEAPVAIKVLRGGENVSELSERLRVEGRAVAKLVHPNIVRVFDIGETESGEPFIVMELLHGETLGAILERGALAPISALQLLLPIAEALSLAHSRGVVHRDLKPDNIVIADEGSVVQPKLLDFGIAKVRSALASGAPALTLTGTLLGSPDYMSPEQAHGRADIDERSDVWSFCVVLYEAIAGQAPFQGESCHAVLRSVAYEEHLPLMMVADVDAALSEIVQRGLAKDRELRPASIFELGRELAAWLWEHGVYEDAAGCSLEAKWLARPNESTRSCALYDPNEQRWEYERATLVSVVHPELRPGSADPIVLTPPKRGRRWAPSVLVLSCAVVGCLAWAARHPSDFWTARAGTFMTTAPTPVSELAAVSPPAQAERRSAVTDLPLVTIEASPALPAVPVEAVPLEAPPAVSRNATAARSLPQALPRRETQRDLLNPY
jgi:eukaryotic-like serine/threonine-protein kinase